ncbi:MAG: DNA-processing protein DprA [Acidimicrobiales bacterium]
MSAQRLPEEAWVVALSSLPGLGPARLRSLLALGEPEMVWRSVLSGTLPNELSAGVSARIKPGLCGQWRTAARSIDPGAYWQAHVDAGIGVMTQWSASFPDVLAQDDDAPVVLFWLGDIDRLAGTRVAIVGTRRATRYGIDVANEFARELSLAGVAVVSGLALGIDGAAHAGALAVDGAPPIAVVGSGLDHIYPRAHRALWRAVAERGVVMSEYPLGASAVAWQFPARNRIIAALADVVVVVESQSTGGALGTAVEAARRGRTVLAVPGPITAPSSAGTNQLLFDGCGPVRDVGDVLLALGLQPERRRTATEQRPSPIGNAKKVLEALPWQAIPVEQIIDSTGLDLGVVMLALLQLETDGWVAQRSGWIERIARGGAQ